MKRYLIIMVLGFSIALTACSKETFNMSVIETVTETKEENIINVVNPLTEYDSLEALNAVSSTRLVKPGIMGITDEQFNLIDCDEYTISEYTFNLNGINYILRGAPVTEDISGVYLNGKSAFDDNTDGSQEFIYDDEMKLARWFCAEGQYVFSSLDNGKLDNDTFSSMVSEIKTLTNHLTDTEVDETIDETTDHVPESVDDIAPLAGKYNDLTSREAYMNAYMTDKDKLDITIYWGNSGSETSEWHMTAYRTFDGKLEYNDCSSYIVKTSENGESSKEMIYESGSGYFTIEGNTLRWDGAVDENCKDCIFEQQSEHSETKNETKNEQN